MLLIYIIVTRSDHEEHTPIDHRASDNNNINVAYRYKADTEYYNSLHVQDDRRILKNPQKMP